MGNAAYGYLAGRETGFRVGIFTSAWTTAWAASSAKALILAKTIAGTALRWRNCLEFGGCGAVELGMGAAVHVQIGRRNPVGRGANSPRHHRNTVFCLSVGYQAEAINSPMSSSLSASRPRDANHVHMFRQSRCRSSVPRSFPARSTNWGRSMITSLSPAASTL